MLRSEFIKVFSLKRWTICILSFILINFVSLNLNFKSNDNTEWRKEAISTKDIYLDMINKYGNNEIYEKEIRAIDYSLENNIPYNVGNIWSYLSYIDNYFNIIILILIIIASRVFYIEYEYATWKNLLMSSKDIKQIILSKYIYCIIEITISILVLFCITFIFGLFEFGLTQPNNIVAFKEENTQIISQLDMVIERVLTLYLVGLFYMSMTNFLIILFDGKKVAIFSVISILFFAGLINILLEKIIPNFNRLLPFYYISKRLDIIQSNKLIYSIIMLSYSIIILTGGMFVFLNRRYKIV
ncbi:ABC transporter permease [Gemella cuniculi]|uniref:ABC transporter permease n=1 Tax=Gemella cuniculi TaxID=150240 RepID=UPI0003FEFAD4|nr:ABC transporter permease [Gemella cuniculi]